MLNSNPTQLLGKPLRLRRVHHSEEIVSGFSKLLKSESMTDVTLICNGGQTIRAHQVILATFSPYFRAIFEAAPFTNNPCQYPVIVIKDLAYPELRAILEFIYRGEVSISRDKLSAVLQAAKALEVSGLSDLKVDSALNGTSITSSTASAAPDSSDVLDSEVLASLTAGHQQHNSMAALNAVNNGKRPHESLINSTTSMFGGLDGHLKKARVTLDQVASGGPISMERLGISLLGENGINLSNNSALAGRFGQDPFNLRRSLDRTISDLMQQNQQLKHAMTVEQFLQQRQLRQQKVLQRNSQPNKQQILQQHLLQKNPSPSKSPSSEKPDETSPNHCNLTSERLVKHDGSPKRSDSSASPGGNEPDRPEDMSKTATSFADEDKSANGRTSPSNPHHSNGLASRDGEESKSDQESGRNGDARDDTENDEEKSNMRDDEDADVDIGDENPLQLTIETNHIGEGNKNGEESCDRSNCDADDRRSPRSPRSLVRADYGNSNSMANGTEDDLGDDDSPRVKQEVDIEEDHVTMNNTVDDMNDYMDQDDINGKNDDYEVQMAKADLIFQRQQQLRLQQLQRQQYQQLLQLQQDQQEAKLLEFYEQLQHANAMGRFPGDADIDPSTVISLDWKEGFMDDSCPEKQVPDHPLANSLMPISRSLAGLVSARNGIIAGRDLKNPSVNNVSNGSNGNSNGNGTTGSTPLITPDFLQPRGPGRPRKGNKAQDISPCPECNKVFVRPDVLKLHYRSVHLNERHPCNLCPKIFKWPGDLSKHKRTKHPEAMAAAAAAKASA